MESNPVDKSSEEGSLDCLRYFSFFNYPLTADEIYMFNSSSTSKKEIFRAIERLLDKKKIFKVGGFYALVNNEEWAKERQRGNYRASQLLGKSAKYISIIAGFPFVRGIAISGSLSKFYASETTDIDYFIITESNRLWISRSLLHVFKKFSFVTGHQHYFCMNYFVDQEALLITHPNQYSAVELATLLPAFNLDLINRFYDTNNWVKSYLPNHPGITNHHYLISSGSSPVKRMVEYVLNLLFPLRLNKFLMNFTDKKWRRKWNRRGYDEEAYDRAFMTDLHISKNHPVDFEKLVLASLEKNKKT